MTTMYILRDEAQDKTYGEFTGFLQPQELVDLRTRAAKLGLVIDRQEVPSKTIRDLIDTIAYFEVKGDG